MIEFSSLLKEHMRKLLNDVFGIDAKSVKSFSEQDEVRIVADTYAWIEGISEIGACITIYIRDFHCLNIGYGIECREYKKERTNKIHRPCET